MSDISRRHLLVASASVVTVALAAKAVAGQAPADASALPFKLDPLPYASNALEPYIDALTMELHHDRHHAAYVANLNNVAKEYPRIGQVPIRDLLAKLAELPDTVRTTVRNNLGGHSNHTMFWEILGPDGGNPTDVLAAAIERDLGGMDELQRDFNTAGLRVFGSGWVFVTVGYDGKLAIETRPNQDSPLMDGREVVFGNDLWEHSYYVKYQNRRADYLKAWWNAVSWTKISERYAAATQHMTPK